MESISSLCGELPVFSFCIAVSVPLLKKSRFFCANSLYFLVIFIMRHSDAADSRPLLPAYLVYRRQACAVSLLNTWPLLARLKGPGHCPFGGFSIHIADKQANHHYLQGHKNYL